MSVLPLFAAIEPRANEIRLLISEPGYGPRLKARLPVAPRHSQALVTTLEAMSLWFSRPVHGVLDADAADVRAYPERWAALLEGADQTHVHVEWLAVPRAPSRDRFLGTLGSFQSASRLLAHATGGRR